MTLFVIGLGLFDEKDITLRALEAVRSSERVYLEAYTSILMVEDYQERLVRDDDVRWPLCNCSD